MTGATRRPAPREPWARRAARALAAGALAAAALSVAPASAPAPAAAGEEDATLRVMSFNVRWNNPLDGEDAWSERKELVVETIREFEPDLVGLQEVRPEQARYLDAQLDGLAYFGAGRDGGGSGEQCGILFRKRRFATGKRGHFWLSETPDRPGSRGWDAALPRMVTWIQLRDRASERAFTHFNTHFDHEGEEARLESARLVRRLLFRGGEARPAIVTGDLNCTEEGEPYAALVGEEDDGPALVDAYRAVHPERGLDEMTFHDFEGVTLGLRIDFVLHTEHFAATAAGIDRTERDGRYPSDHFPVTAVLELR